MEKELPGKPTIQEPRAKARKKRRVRSPHPGVKLKKRTLPSGATSWRAIFVDPDTDRETYVTLDLNALPTLEMRRGWAIGKSKAIARRRMELDGGAPRATGTELGKAIQRYFDAHKGLRPRTIEIYRKSADKFEAWAEQAGVQSFDSLDRAKLMAFREARASMPKRVQSRGGKRGGRAVTKQTRAPGAINQELRSVRTILGYLHDADLLPRLSYDDLRRALKLQKAPREAPEFLRPAECRRLLEAALRHDADTFKETREEHRSLRVVGSTERYDPIAHLVAFVLLSGCRVGEALALKWSDVDLDAVDADGRVVGEIRLCAAATKTGHARLVSLDVCPMLRKVLAALKLKAGEGPYVFGAAAMFSRALAESSRKRLIAEFGAPRFSWQTLRSTCATVQCNAPALWGTAAPFVSAKRLGHSVVVSEKRYAGQLAVSRDARTLESAMQIEDVMMRVIAKVDAAVNPKIGAVG